MLSNATDYYAAPSDQGNNCTFDNPCSLNEAMGKAFGGDRVLLKDGTYTQTFKTVRGGSSNTNRITFRAVNRHQAIVRFPGSGHTHFHIDHSWITVSGIRINATSSGGSHAFDASKISNTSSQHAAIQGILFEDNYVHDSGHLLMWSGNTTGAGVEVRYNTFDKSGHTDEMGEGFYWGSAHSQNPGIVNAHHNILSRYKANCVDFKGEYRDGNFHDNICMDHELWTATNPDHQGDGTFVIGNGEGDVADSSTNNMVRDNMIFRPKSSVIFNGHDGTQLRFIGNVVVDYVGRVSTAKRLNNSDMQNYSTSHSNIHCPSQGIEHGEQTHGSSPPNQINQPIAECNDRIDEIVGKPVMASCNIGNLDDNTVTVNIETTKNGPVSWISANLEVTYNGTNQTGETTTQFSGNQARIAVVTPPANDAVTVRVVAPAGAIHNSAFIGGKNCSNFDNFGNANYIRGAGFCGENNAQTLICTNTTEGTGPPPIAEALNQAVWRFYAIHNSEGAAPIAPENTNITSREGGEFRWRVGVRGGGNDSPSRSYALAARVCKPACGQWFNVSDDPNVGVVFLDDQVQDNGTATTNQLALGGKTFLAGVFIDTPIPTPAKAIASTQQIEWEFGLQIPAESTAVNIGDTVELRIEHDDSTALSAYTLPSITILGADPASYSGSITGSLR